MRNTLEYPITQEEMINYLDKLYQEEIKDGGIGSMKPSIILEIKKELQAYWELLDKWEILIMRGNNELSV